MHLTLTGTSVISPAPIPAADAVARRVAGRHQVAIRTLASPTPEVGIETERMCT
jgi:hypothetical protein